MQLRPYQQEAINATYQWLRTHSGNPCIVAPTGSGKSPIIATICRDAVKLWHGRVLVLAHVKELLEQTANTLRKIDPTLDIGVYSAGLNSRDTSQSVIVAGIQSIYNKAFDMGKFNLILVDECHLLPPDGEGMYQTFLSDARLVNPKIRIIGLTATPYRLKSGRLCGPDTLLNEISYEIDVQTLIEQGFLCPLISKSGRKKVDFGGLHIRQGEYIQSEMDELFNTHDNVQSACNEMINLCCDRHHVLIFACSVKHAQNIKETIEKVTSQECGIVTGETPAREREMLLRRFRHERIRGDLFGITEKSPLKYLVNVNVLTTGYDEPRTDAVVLLRPTASAGLYAQMVGRGFRLHDSKTNCLILDYGGNILRHGPVDSIRIKEKDPSECSEGTAPVKECPKCCTIVHAAVATCPDCGYEFPKKDENEKHDASAADTGILSGEIVDTTYQVEEVYYSVHQKRNTEEAAPKTVKIEYKVGFNHYVREWVCPEHRGYAREKFKTWWKSRSNEPVPESAREAAEIANLGGCAKPISITVRSVTGEKFTNVVRYELPDEKPELVDRVDPFTHEKLSFDTAEAMEREPGGDDEPYAYYGGVFKPEEIPF